MSLFPAEKVEAVKKTVGQQSVLLAPASDDRVFVQITLVKGSPVWLRRGSTATLEEGLYFLGVGSVFRCEDWLGDISCISEGQTLITGEIGYA